MVDLWCVAARIEEETCIDAIRRAPVRVCHKGKVIVEGPLYIFHDLDDLFIEQNRSVAAIAAAKEMKP